MGFERDKLDRKAYADILTGIIDNPKKYKRNSDSDSFTMAVDSGWGTGKTEFLNMWKEELEKEKDKYIVIRYDAWENDFAKDPLQSIIYTILADKTFNKQNDIKNGKETLKKAFKAIIDIAEESKIPGIKVLTTGAKEIPEVVKTMFQETSMDDKIEEYIKYKSSIETIKTELGKITKKTKVILQIDELDRCKPLFAIKLLEVIKHIFNVENMSFVFALDMTQLSHSVKKVYGSDIDAPGYLCRFFDYITKMPKPDTEKYIEYLTEKKPPIRREISCTQKSIYSSRAEIQVSDVSNILHDFAQKYQLSLRDLDTIYSNFIILEERELKDVDNRSAYELYLFLLIVKYKNLSLFNKIFITHNVVIKDEEYLQKILKRDYIDANTIKLIGDNENIERILKREMRLTKVNNIKKNYAYKIEDGYGYMMPYNSQTNWLNCIFYSDIDNYNNIKDMGIADYIHQKLELFDFTWEQQKEEQ